MTQKALPPENPEDWHYEPAEDQEIPLHQRPTSELREVGLVGAMGHWVWRRALRSILGWRNPVTVIGRENLPADTPFVVVANHTSHLDALVLGMQFPETLFGRVFSLAAGDYFFDSYRKSVIAAQLVNALPVWRGKPSTHALRHLRERLDHGHCGFVVFPEGTRSRDGTLDTFKPGIGMLVAGTEVPVIPCVLQGCYEAWPAKAKRPKPGPIQLTVLPPMHFADQPNKRAGWCAVAQALESKIRCCLEGSPLPTTTG